MDGDKLDETAPEKATFVRIALELEFVQCLANPRYLQFLSQQRYFQECSFINYLKYLSYWKRPEYAKFIVYPHSLFFLELLQDESFRQELSNPLYVESIWKQQFYHWRYYKQNRVRNDGNTQVS